MDLYAVEHTEVTTLRPDPICTPLSTDSLSSVEQIAYTGYTNGTSFTDNIAIKYTKDTCGLTVILECTEDETPIISA